MTRSKATDHADWPPILRQSQWRKALGLYWLVKSPKTRIGPTMEEAYKRFRAIDWDKYDALDQETDIQDFYSKRIGPLVGSLERIQQLAIKECKENTKNGPPNNFVLLAKAVAEAAKTLADSLEQKRGSPHTPRSRPGPNSASASATLAGTSHNSAERKIGNDKCLWDKYKKCSEWPAELTGGHYSVMTSGERYGDEAKIKSSIIQIHNFFRKIHWDTYR